MIFFALFFFLTMTSSMLSDSDSYWLSTVYLFLLLLATEVGVFEDFSSLFDFILVLTELGF